MDKLDRAFLTVFRSDPRAARWIVRHGVVRFRRQFRQEARLVDYATPGEDAFRVLGYVENLMNDMLARAAMLHSPRKVNP